MSSESYESSTVLADYEAIRCAAESSADGTRCLVTTSPEARERLQDELDRARKNATRRESDASNGFATLLHVKQPTRVGFNDGLIIPGNYFPPGTPANLVRSAAADRAPLTGTVRVVVVLVDFSDEEMTESAAHYEELFFSTGTLANGSVKEYFAETSNNQIDIVGEVVGPYRLPQTLATYTNGASGIGSATPNARTMARDAAVAADPDVDFGPYDNDGDGFVDAFIVIHAGQGAEQTLSPNDIWSHKWVLSGGAYTADTSKIYAYLTVPEDCRIGVCCHELGHLLFGWPDLYDTDSSSEGLGNWCLMAGGSWNGGVAAEPGDIPAHPSAWCKADQGWVNVVNHTSNTNATIPDVKDSHEVHRLWKDGTSGSEYFLVENRQQDRYDSELPGEGLLIYHVDDDITSNSDETHYKVGLEQADGDEDLENAVNRGDDGDPFPGSSGNRTFNETSTPNSMSYNDADTCVAVTNISDPGPTMNARFTVRCGPGYKLAKEKEFRKEFVKELSKTELKEPIKERKELKEKDFKEKERKEFKEKERKEFKEFDKGDQPDKRPEKPDTDKNTQYEKNPVTEGKDRTEGKLTDGKDLSEGKFTDGKLTEGGFGRESRGDDMAELRARIETLERQLSSPEPFISQDLRPDLRRGALAAEDDLDEATKRMAEGDRGAKRSFDTKPRDHDR
jgi:immune inhibitor A